jgi:hypothetical protein
MNKSLFTSLGLFIAFMVVLLSPCVSSAQITNPQGVSGSSMAIVPENPKFGDTVTASVKNIYKNLNTIKISWYVDGVLKKEGVGITSFSFDLSKNPQTTTIRAIMDFAGSENEIEKTIQPRDVDLIFEPQSYIPFFYKGSPLFITQGIMKIIALPIIYIDGQKISDNNLYYTWMRNGVVDGNASGKGKNIFIFSGNGISDDTDIDLTVQDSNKKITAEKVISISPASPKVLMYENSPLYGILFNRALTGIINMGSKEEIDIVAFPFNFDVSTPDSSDLNLVWSINGKSYNTSGKKNTIILKQVDTLGSGSSNISISVENRARMFQSGSFGFTLKYEK